MKKRADRIFHLSIAAVAVAITVISVWSVAQSLPPSVQKHIRSFTTVTANQTGSNQAVASSPTSSSAISNVSLRQASVGSSRYHASFKNIHVRADGAHVTSADVARVRTMLERTDAPALIQQTLHLTLKKPALIEVVSGVGDYQKALEALGVSVKDASSLSTTSGGFTQNSTVVLPIDQNADNTDLANTVTHELTHVFVNQNVGSLPSWLNEGIAVFMGMRGQKTIESGVNFASDQRQFAENILDVSSSHGLQPLTSNEEAILSGQSSYDYELQDWLAVSDLIQKDGIGSVRKYLNLIGRHDQPSQAFVVAFGEREDIFNKHFSAVMAKASAATDDGVHFTLHIAPMYHGNIGFLQHGQSRWQVFKASPGDYQMTVGPKGQVSGGLTKISSSLGRSPSDNHTLYLSLLPKTPETYHGHRVTDSGFAFDMHNGLYSFQDTWITLDTGDTLYLSTPSLYGVSIQSAMELNTTDPLLKMFATE